MIGPGSNHCPKREATALPKRKRFSGTRWLTTAIAVISALTGCAVDPRRTPAVRTRHGFQCTCPESTRAGRPVPRRLGKTLPPGSRAVTVRLDSTSNPVHWIRQGDHVDIAVVIASRHGTPQSSRMLMQHVQVLAVVQYPEARKTVHAVTVLALPREAQALSVARQQGELVLFLRNAKDRNPAPTSASASASASEVTAQQIADPQFWLKLHDQRLRSIQPPPRNPTLNSKDNNCPTSPRKRDIAL